MENWKFWRLIVGFRKSPENSHHVASSSSDLLFCMSSLLGRIVDQAAVKVGSSAHGRGDESNSRSSVQRFGRLVH